MLSAYMLAAGELGIWALCLPLPGAWRPPPPTSSGLRIPRAVVGPGVLLWPLPVSHSFPQAVELPDSFSPELRSLLEGLLQRDVNRRLGCLGRG